MPEYVELAKSLLLFLCVIPWGEGGWSSELVLFWRVGCWHGLYWRDHVMLEAIWSGGEVHFHLALLFTFFPLILPFISLTSILSYFFILATKWINIVNWHAKPCLYYSHK